MLACGHGVFKYVLGVYLAIVSQVQSDMLGIAVIRAMADKLSELLAGELLLLAAEVITQAAQVLS